MTLNPARLRAVRTLDDIVELLSRDLDWGFGVEQLDNDQAFFEFTAEELGIPADTLPSLRSIRQLRPLVAGQPWGVIFLEFTGPRLPLTPLRRLLQSLVTKKRTGSSQHRTWQKEDLLFIVTTGSEGSIEFHFVAFFEAQSHLSEIRSLQWRPRHSPEQHLRRLATELLPRLTWPEDESDLGAWRAQWRSAFQLRHGEVLAGAAQLADRMAEVAIALRNRIGEALTQESSKGPFHALMREVRTELVAQLDADGFADMCAQTLVYGTLTARVTDPIGFGASPSLSTVPLANPFLAAFFERVHDELADLDLERAGLEQLVADLRRSNVEAILDQFGATAKGGDPVVHFYEEFLKRYDPKDRKDAGAFYTPQPAVQFMVRAVDHVLKSRFGLTAGVGDDAPWSEVARELGLDVPDGVDPNSPFVSMIDPATGTGTFLVEWLRQAAESIEKARGRQLLARQLRDVVLPSMHAFEFNVAPYAVAHLKVALEAHNLGVPAESVRIHLTNTLEHPSIQSSLSITDDPVAMEGQRAASHKVRTRFTVCIGNPPYDRQQRANAAETVKGGVVRHGVPGTPALMEDILKPMRDAGLGQHAKNLYNDYVYFWRWATWQVTALPPGPGVVAFITASSYLDGMSMGGLREHLRRAFDDLWIIDLGGEGRGARTEENIFDIRTPVAIAIGVRYSESPRSAEVRYVRVPERTREGKLAWLAQTTLPDISWEGVKAEGLEPLIPEGESTYRSWPAVNDLFPLVIPGTGAGRTWVIGPSESVLTRRASLLLDTPGRSRATLFKDSPTGRKAHERLRKSIMPGDWDVAPVNEMRQPPRLGRFAFRTLDRQFIVADPRFIDRPGPTWGITSHKQVFLTSLTSSKLGWGPVATATPYLPDRHHFRGSYGGKDVMPLWRDVRATRPNVTRGLLTLLGERLGIEVTAERLLSYVYGLAGTPAFAEHFSDELGEAAGPFRVPISADAATFDSVAELGADLLWWHTWGERYCPDGTDSLPAGSAEIRTPIHGYPEDFAYDPESEELHVGTGVIAPIPADVWEFEVSGLRVLRSWLGYRMPGGKGRKSSPLDDVGPERWTFTEELLRVIAIIEHTLAVTPEAARLIEKVVDGPVFQASELPVPSAGERKPPRD